MIASLLTGQYKMHDYIMTRGNKFWVDKLIKRLEGVTLPLEFTFDKSKPKQKIWFEMGVRPIQFWEIVYPEPCKELVRNTLLDLKMGETQHSKHKKVLGAMRYLMGLKKIEYNWDVDKIKSQFGNVIPLDLNGKIPIINENVEVIGVGTKADRYTEHGEML